MHDHGENAGLLFLPLLPGALGSLVRLGIAYDIGEGCVLQNLCGGVAHVEKNLIQGTMGMIFVDERPELLGVAKGREWAVDEADDFAEVLQDTLVRFDNLWQMPFPYVMPLHQAPTDDGDYRAFHFHIEFHPPLRRPNLLKHLAGPEIGGGNFLSDTSPEEKAAELRALPNVNYTERT